MARVWEGPSVLTLEAHPLKDSYNLGIHCPYFGMLLKFFDFLIICLEFPGFLLNFLEFIVICFRSSSIFIEFHWIPYSLLRISLFLLNFPGLLIVCFELPGFT